MSARVRLAVVGCGAIGSTLIEYLGSAEAKTGAAARLQLKWVIVPARSLQRVADFLQRLGLEGVEVRSDLSDCYADIDVVIECAGHEALEMHGVPALAQGCSLVVSSVGACAHETLLAQLEQASALGGGRIQFVAGAVGAIDALAAARHSGLSQVQYRGVKPALAWLGTPAEALVDLRQLDKAEVFFTGTARAAAQQYPQNANVAATVALAGLGLDHTKVQLVADPKASLNSHLVEAQGGFGSLRFEVFGRPLPDNPKSSALTAYSVIQAALNLVQPWYF